MFGIRWFENTKLKRLCGKFYMKVYDSIIIWLDIRRFKNASLKCLCWKLCIKEYFITGPNFKRGLISEAWSACVTFLTSKSNWSKSYQNEFKTQAQRTCIKFSFFSFCWLFAYPVAFACKSHCSTNVNVLAYTLSHWALIIIGQKNSMGLLAP